ncbi:hypothetical protein AAFF_G00268500 [Aldrovandia affinis]|uniref:Uncharacterized protein n=1 Tax=Aldrovandia affinis TaxID=143900 RepID=A0AAD7SSF0_9TELE|nr:hypothetical protein AAFF_G00268500 [Aldrovandia affinis]
MRALVRHVTQLFPACLGPPLAECRGKCWTWRGVSPCVCEGLFSLSAFISVRVTGHCPSQHPSPGLARTAMAASLGWREEQGPEPQQGEMCTLLVEDRGLAKACPVAGVAVSPPAGCYPAMGKLPVLVGAGLGCAPAPAAGSATLPMMGADPSNEQRDLRAAQAVLTEISVGIVALGRRAVGGRRRTRGEMPLTKCK